LSCRGHPWPLFLPPVGGQNPSSPIAKNLKNYNCFLAAIGLEPMTASFCARNSLQAVTYGTANPKNQKGHKKDIRLFSPCFPLASKKPFAAHTGDTLIISQGKGNVKGNFLLLPRKDPVKTP
jgi:hypothetical protein